MTLPTRDIPLTVEDLNRLAKATADEAKLTRDWATTHPLRSHDPNTKRYEMMEDAAALGRRARHFRTLAEQMEREATT